MTKIYIIGTDHNFQKGHGRYKEDAMAFREYVREISVLTHVKAIGEEMSREALDEVEVETSACEAVAYELTLTHFLCDPDRATRKRLGIRDENEIRLEGSWKDWAPEQVQKKIFEEHRKREGIWLSYIDNSDYYPVLYLWSQPCPVI